MALMFAGRRRTSSEQGPLSDMGLHFAVVRAGSSFCPGAASSCDPTKLIRCSFIDKSRQVSGALVSVREYYSQELIAICHGLYIILPICKGRGHSKRK